MNAPPHPHGRLTTWLTAAVVGAVGMLLASLLTAPVSVPFAGHGESFAAQAVDPLSLVGKFPQRILWPLLAHFAGLVGIGPAAFSQVCSGALLAVVFWFCRVHGARAIDALLVTAAIAATGAVQLYQVMTCHSDTLNWILLLLLFHHVRRPVLFWVLVLLSALSHEMVFFLAPWLVYQRCRNGGSPRREIGALLVTGFVYWLWLQIVKSVGSGPTFSPWYYVTENWLVLGTLGLWLLWAMLLVIEFGPLLAIVVRGVRTDRLGMGRWGVWFYTACVLSTMAFAYDVQRFACHAFLPLVLGSLAFLAANGAVRAVYTGLLVLGVGAYAALHWIPGQAGGWPFDRAWSLVLEFGTHAPGTRHRFFTHVIPHAWPAVLAFTAAAAAIVATGLWLARRFPGGPQDGRRTNRSASP